MFYCFKCFELGRPRCLGAADCDHSRLRTSTFCTSSLQTAATVTNLCMSSLQRGTLVFSVSLQIRGKILDTKHRRLLKSSWILRPWIFSGIFRWIVPCSLARPGGCSPLSGISQWIFTSPADFHRSCQWHFPTDFHLPGGIYQRIVSFPVDFHRSVAFSQQI